VQKLSVGLMILLLGVAGCGDKGEESFAKKAGGKVGETVTDFATGVGKGIDKQLTVQVDLLNGLADRGVSKTVAKTIPYGFSIYLVAAKPLKSQLIAKALNKEGQEIGRCVVEVEFAGDDAKYVHCTFPEDMDTQLVEKFTLDLK
jgi:hypothetical protein